MSKSEWHMEIFNSKGELWERIRNEPRASLRSSGVAFTTGQGQSTWTCRLFYKGAHIATCKRGVWKEAIK